MSRIESDKVYNKDVLEVLKQLPDNSIDMVYGDPDYNVGIDYTGVRYTQKWARYIEWYVELSAQCMRVLAPHGNLFMINYPKQNAHLRVQFLDSHAYDVQDYVWIYNTNIGHSKKRFTTAHRSILHATKSKHNHFYKEQVAVPYQNPTDKRIQQRMRHGSNGRMPYSWLYFDLVKNVSRDKTLHPCQLPTQLFETFCKASTRPGDLCFILFGGSGNELVKCRDLNRHYLSCELQKDYYEHMVSKLSTSVPQERAHKGAQEGLFAHS